MHQKNNTYLVRQPDSPEGRTGASHTYLTSGSTSTLSSALHTLRMDKIEFRAGIQCVGLPQEKQFRLPKLLADAFENEFATVRATGFLNPRGRSSFSTNGAILSRLHFHLPSPRSGINRNQLSDEELVGKVGELNAYDHIELFLNLLSQLHVYSGCIFQNYCLHAPITFPYVEAYIEFLCPADRPSFIQTLSGAISQQFGAAIKEINERKNTRSAFVKVWEIRHKVQRRKKEKIRLKAYLKGDRIRLEISFNNFRSPTNGSDNSSLGRFDIEGACRALLHDLHTAAAEIFAELVPHLSKYVHQKIDAALLRQKLREYNSRGVVGHKYTKFIEALEERGVYDPACEESEYRLAAKTLKRLSDSADGILWKKSSYDSRGRAKRNFFRLKSGWQTAHPNLGTKKREAND